MPLSVTSRNKIWPNQLRKQMSSIAATVSELVASELEAMPAYRIMCCNVSDAAAYLGVEPDTVRDWIKAGKLRASKPSKDWLIRVIDLEALLAKTATVITIKKKKNG